MAGRPTKLTPEVQAEIVTAIAGGNTRDTAAAYARINRATLYDWLAKGKKPGARAIYRDFSDAIEKAEADAIATAVALIRRAAQESWQAAAWWLERRYPDEWGRKDRVTIEALVRTEAERMASELGIDPEAVIAETERILQSTGH